MGQEVEQNVFVWGEKNMACLNRCDSLRKKNVSIEVNKKWFQKYVNDKGLIKSIFMIYLGN